VRVWRESWRIESMPPYLHPTHETNACEYRLKVMDNDHTQKLGRDESIEVKLGGDHGV